MTGHVRYSLSDVKHLSLYFGYKRIITRFRSDANAIVSADKQYCDMLQRN